jgi:UDP-2,4-diacetamido-2,4,6-trideoxy-beta-L-altropyranose hydrolase
VADDADEPAVIAAQIVRLGADALVLDSYALGGPFLAAVQQRVACARIVVDDLGDRLLPCDVLLNGNPFAAAIDYRATGARRLLLGPRWALLRPDLLPGRRPPRGRPGPRPHVLVTLGGSRLGAEALALAQAIVEAAAPCRVTLLLGDGDDAGPARAWAGAALQPVQVVQGAPSVAALLSATDLAVAGAGTTCLELAACGVPALLLVVADNQRRSAAAWHGRAGFEVLGDVGRVAADAVAARVAALLADPDERARRAEPGPRLVDGAGAVRAAEVVLAAASGADLAVP